MYTVYPSITLKGDLHKETAKVSHFLGLNILIRV